MKKVLLINPRYHVRHPALGLGYLVGYIRKYLPERFVFDLVDYAFDSDIHLEGKLESFKPDLIGITATTNTFMDAKRICALIKKDYDCPVILGGVHITSVPTDLLLTRFDLAVYGEGEATFCELLDKWDKTGILGDPCIDGLVLRTESGIIQTSRRKFIENLDDIPYPAYDLFNMKGFYAKPHALAHGFYAKGASMMTSRGCPYSNCSFCGSDIMWMKKLRSFSARRVFEETAYLMNTYNLNGIIYLDDNFTTNRHWLAEVSSYIKESDFGSFFRCDIESIAEFLDEEKAQLLKSMGCERIEFGFESGNERVLKAIKNDKCNLEKTSMAIKICNKYKIKVLGNFIFGWFDETLQEVKKTLQFINSHRIDFQAWHTLAVYPGTRAFEQLVKVKGFDNNDIANLYEKSTTNNLQFYNEHLLGTNGGKLYGSIAAHAQERNLHTVHDLNLTNIEKQELYDSFLQNIHSNKTFYYTTSGNRIQTT